MAEIPGFVACAIGMTCKEVMVSAPLVVFLYDRIFVSGTFREAWRRHRSFHLALLSTLLVLGLVLSMDGRGTTAGFGTDIRMLWYVFIQIRAVVHYLSMVFWPSPMIFDYGVQIELSLSAVAGYAAVLTILLVATCYLLVRRPTLGFLGLVFFVLLAPSSSFIVIATQTIADHRVYLASAAIITGVVLLLHRFTGRRAFILCGVWSAALAIMTIQRNEDYRSAVVLWQDNVAKWPVNPRGYYNLGIALNKEGRPAEALDALRVGERRYPKHVGIQNELGKTLSSLKQFPDALEHFKNALVDEPDFTEARFNAAKALLASHRPQESASQFQMVMDRNPGYPGARAGLGAALIQLGDLPEAVAQFRLVEAEQPDSAEWHATLGSLLGQLGKAADAVREWNIAIGIASHIPEYHNELGLALAQLGKVDDASLEFAEALALDGSYADARRNLDALRQQRQRQ